MSIQSILSIRGVRILSNCTLLIIFGTLPFAGKSQILGANMSNPIVIGNYGQGTYTFSDTRNNSTTNGYLNDYGQSSDDIYYKLTVQGTTTLSISLCSATFDTYLHLLNANGQNIVFNDDSGPLCGGVQSSLQTTVQPGIYYIVTEGYSSNTGSLPLSVSSVVQAPPPTVYDTRNFIRVWEASAPETNPNTLMTKSPVDVKQSTQYFDGLGRPEQTVIAKGSLSNNVFGDLVSPVVYDAFGREAQKYLPYVSGSTDGLFKTNPLTEQNSFYTSTSSPIYGQGETLLYGKTNFEASPLNRVQETFAPGNSWVGTAGDPSEANRKSVKAKYYLNTTIDEVRIWTVSNSSTIGVFGTYSSSAAYGAGQLFKNITVDENGKQVIEFKDKEGQVILKKVQLIAAADNGSGSSHNDWLCTYYIYDDLNNLRCVIQPRGVELIAPSWALTDITILAEQCFRYEYDQRNRMIMKKVPGAGEVYMVYDNRDRIVATSTATGRGANYTGYCYWIFNLYDEINRPIATGEMHTCLGLQGMINYVNALPDGNITFNTQPGTPMPITAWKPIVTNATSTIYSNWYINTITHYDDYVGLPSGISDFLTTWSADNFSPTNTITWPYPQLPQKSTAVRNMVTWNVIRVLGSADYQKSANYYDEKGRLIQVQNTNLTGGIDVSTTQYSWAGQSLVVVNKTEKAGANAQTSVIVSQLIYDDLGRLVKTEKKISNTLVNNNSMPAFKIIAKIEYDALGNLKKKILAPSYNNNIGLETLKYDYNIRGWMLGVNRDFARDAVTSNYFGFDLGYDKVNNNIIGGQTYLIPQYNGNISGTVWKSKGDGEKRKYDFSYDAVNRLIGANFNQYTNGNFNKTAMIDFSVSNLTFDYNGNIKTMNQKGLTLNTSPVIDQLSYTYNNNSNKLAKVADQTVITDNGKLGDFKDGSNSGTDDYAYDTDGNLKLDNNKSISSITYNHLSLPVVISIIGKGTISYTYDAVGNKLKKVVVEKASAANNNITTTNTTTYLGGAIYESKTDNNAATVDYTDRLQLIAHEEGRIRFKPDNYTLEYDYMLKDHLGNVRMVLTDEQQVDPYPAATMEAAQTVTEELLYANLNTTRIDKPVSYPVDNTTNPNAKVAKVSAAAGMQKVGPSITLKVMAGDQFNLKVSSWYKTSGASPGTPISPLPDLLAALISGVSGASGGKVATTQLQTSGVLTPGATQFLNNQTPDATRPKAYLNWILFDEQFNFVNSSSGAEQVPVETAFGTVPNQNVYQHIKSNLTIDKCGYLYVYVSNETPNIDVFFDNLQVTHVRGPILEINNYYPYGLLMSGISSKAAGGLENRKKYNGIEFDEDLDIDSYEAFYRNLDPQTGRWWQIDPKVEGQESLSPYNSMANDPIRYSDPLGDIPNDGGPGDPPSLATRIWGGVKAVGGLVEMGVGAVGGAATSWTGVGAVVGVAAVVHGADVVSSGLSQMFSGTETKTFTEQGISKGLQTTGVSEQKANTVASYADGAISAALTAGSGAVANSSRVSSGVTTTKTSGQLGREGMAGAGIEQNTTRIPSATGKAAYRVPDGLTKTTLTEVKNVGKQSYTSQIKDYVHYSKQNGLQFNLFVRPTTQLSKPIMNQVSNGSIFLKYLPN